MKIRFSHSLFILGLWIGLGFAAEVEARPSHPADRVACDTRDEPFYFESASDDDPPHDSGLLESSGEGEGDEKASAWVDSYGLAAIRTLFTLMETPDRRRSGHALFGFYRPPPAVG